MTDQEIRVAIAARLPNLKGDPLTDLNAMHEAEKMLTPHQAAMFAVFLLPSSDGGIPTPTEVFSASHTTARQRAEAFCKTHGLWKDT